MLVSQTVDHFHSTGETLGTIAFAVGSVFSKLRVS